MAAIAQKQILLQAKKANWQAARTALFEEFISDAAFQKISLRSLKTQSKWTTKCGISTRNLKLIIREMFADTRSLDISTNDKIKMEGQA